MKTDPASLVREFLKAENARDWSAWASYLDANVTYETIGSDRVVSGRENYVSHMQHVYSQLPDWQFTLTSIAATSHVVIVEFQGNGHFSGEHNGRQHQRVPLDLAAVCVFELRADRIAAVREYVDHVGHERQLNHVVSSQTGA